jgi:hypothetical protein
MLIVNADYTPGEFYRRRVSNLCSNQIYRFSAWALNLYKYGTNGIRPNITMQIKSVSGAILGLLIQEICQRMCLLHGEIFILILNQTHFRLM